MDINKFKHVIVSKDEAYYYINNIEIKDVLDFNIGKELITYYLFCGYKLK
jgi:hypothetical protein